MNEVNLPEDYSLEHPTLQKHVGDKEVDVPYTILRKNGEIVLALPTEYCPLSRVEEVIKQIEQLVV